MIGLFCFVLAVLASPFESKLRLEAENAVLRHQLIILRRGLHGRVGLTNHDRWFFIQLYRWFPSILKVLTVIRPETLVRWHRGGFRRYWRSKSHRRGGRPPVEMELRALIRRMSIENPLWGAPRIHGELLKLGFEVAQSSVAKYMVKRRVPPSQGWRTFLHNHAPDIAAMDLFVVPTIGFDLLYAFVIVRLDRRDLVWINVTANPTAEWVARQMTEAFPWDEAPRYMIRDRDRIYGAVVTRRLRAMGIRDKPTAPASPWQNGFAERLIGSIRRECLDHIFAAQSSADCTTNIFGFDFRQAQRLERDELNGARMSPRSHVQRRAFALLQFSVGILLVTTTVQSRAQSATTPPGEALYQQHCTSCHDSGVARAPDTKGLRQLSSHRIAFALAYGVMSQQGRDLSSGEIGEIARFLADTQSTQAPALPDFNCRDPGPQLANPSLPRWNGWGVDIRQHRFQSATQAQLAADDVPRLKLKWAFGFPGDIRAYAQPTVWGGRVFLGSAGGRVYALDAKTGCRRWEFDAGFGVRSAITIVEDARRTTAYFGNQRGEAYAIDAETGQLLWKRRVDEHQAAIITGAPTFANGVLYVPVSSLEESLAADPRYSCCTFRGLIAALDAGTGEIIWRGYISPPAQALRTSATGVQLFGPSGGAIWSAPTIDLKVNAVYATTGDSYSHPAQATSDAFVAFDLATGKLKWSRQMTEGDAYNIACVAPNRSNCPNSRGPDFDFGSSAILVDLPDGKRALIAGQKSGMVHALDPDHDGAILWQRHVGQGSTLGGVQWGSAADDENIYVAVSDIGLEPVPPGTPGGQKPIFGRGAFKMDPRVGGGLFALRLATGEIVWHTPHPGCNDRPGCSPAQSAAVTAIPGIVFSGGLDGHLRAYTAKTGEIIWDVNTMQDYPTVNGTPAHGGSLDGPGAVVAGGMLYVNSGYTNFGTAPGNVLLAFSVAGE